jgi:hypothetical protein
MSVESGLYQLLATNVTVTAAAPGGIYPVILPEVVTKTSVTYRTLSALPSYTLTGSPATTIRIEYTAFAATYLLAKAATDAIRSALDQYTGKLPNDVYVALCWCAGATVDDFESSARLYSSSIDFRVTHSPQ